MDIPSTPDGVRAARLAAGLTQREAATLVHLSRWQTWQDYERGRLPPDPARMHLFVILTRQAKIPRFSRNAAGPRRPGRPPTIGQ